MGKMSVKDWGEKELKWWRDWFAEYYKFKKRMDEKRKKRDDELEKLFQEAEALIEEEKQKIEEEKRNEKCSRYVSVSIG